MKTNRSIPLVMIVTVFLGSIALADMLAPFTKELTWTGTLGWMMEKHADGTEQRMILLQLTTPDQKVIVVRPQQWTRELGQCEQFAGKNLEMRLLVRPYNYHPENFKILKIIGIRELPQKAKS